MISLLPTDLPLQSDTLHPQSWRLCCWTALWIPRVPPPSLHTCGQGAVGQLPHTSFVLSVRLALQNSLALFVFWWQQSLIPLKSFFEVRRALIAQFYVLSLPSIRSQLLLQLDSVSQAVSTDSSIRLKALFFLTILFIHGYLRSLFSLVVIHWPVSLNMFRAVPASVFLSICRFFTPIGLLTACLCDYL